ncbi:hypothetical protein IPH67_02065 [bacterium]|nr:MAG: hypothetical protein IPH67_02065 [bacterium]
MKQKESLCIIKKAKQDRYDWFNRSCIAIVSPRLGITPTKAQASLEYIFQTGWFQNCDMNTEPSLQQLVIPVIKQFRFCQDFNSIPNPIIEKMTLFFLPKLIHLSFKNECSTAAIFYKNDAQWLKKLGYVLEKNVIDNSFILSKHESVQEHE